MSAISLEDVLPEQPEFTIEGKTYRIRLVDLDDQVWIRKKFGDQMAIIKAFHSLDWATITEVVFYLLEDKSDFLARDAEIIDENGDKKKVRLTGPQLLRRHIKSSADGMKLIGALNASIAASNPLLKHYLEKDLKKKMMEAETPTQVPTGASSLISSPLSTDGPSTRSESELSGSSPSP